MQRRFLQMATFYCMLTHVVRLHRDECAFLQFAEMVTVEKSRAFEELTRFETVSGELQEETKRRRDAEQHLQVRVDHTGGEICRAHILCMV